MLDPRLLHYTLGETGPVLGLAVHAGHEIRADIIRHLAIDEAERLREEDPFTDVLSFACDRQLLTRRSRFEVDLNRRRAEAVCTQPADCFGLTIWRPGAAGRVTADLLDEHDNFYVRLEALLSAMAAQHGRFAVFDLHSYNHRRDGPGMAPAPEAENPEINLGTGTMDRARWAPVVERFLSEMRRATVRGRAPDVRENVKFRGREVAHFVHERFPRKGCALAIEIKKTFMDEWSGDVDARHLFELRAALATAAAGVADALAKVEP